MRLQINYKEFDIQKEIEMKQVAEFLGKKVLRGCPIGDGAFWDILSHWGRCFLGHFVPLGTVLLSHWGRCFLGHFVPLGTDPQKF